MGMDLVGKKATTEKGEYFRNNVWWWRPLWMYVCDMCPTILNNNDKERGTYNDGHFINADKAKRIAIRLEHLCNQGEVKKFEIDRKFMLDNLPDIECKICHGSGKRNDEVVQGTCNGCEEKGTVRPWDCSYPFSEKNVKDFAKFCRESGGFCIW